MGRHLRKFIMIGIAAVIGAALGRYASQVHARIEAGEDPLSTDFELDIRPQEIVPGVVAAFRVGEPPWSWLHVPAWLAAFATNFAIAAVGGDLDRLRQTIEERAMGMLGLDMDREVEIHDVTPMPAEDDAPPAPVTHVAPEAPPQPTSSDAPFTPPATPSPASPPASDRTPSGSSSTIWTTGNATPSDSSSGEEPQTRGFTPFSD